MTCWATCCVHDATPRTAVLFMHPYDAPRMLPLRASSAVCPVAALLEHLCVPDLCSNDCFALTPGWWQVDQALVELTTRVKLHSERSRAGQWARVGDDSEVRGVSEERISEVTALSRRSCAPMRPYGCTLPDVCPSTLLYQAQSRKGKFCVIVQHCEM